MTEKVLFEILVGDKPISIFVELSEDMVHFMLAIENPIFNFAHDVSQPSSLRFVLRAGQHIGLNLVQVLIDKSGRRVCPRPLATQIANNLLLVRAENDVSDICAFGMTLSVEHERRHEALYIVLAQFLIEQSLPARVDKEGFEFIYRQVAILVDIRMLDDSFLHGSLVLEAIG